MLGSTTLSDLQHVQMVQQNHEELRRMRGGNNLVLERHQHEVVQLEVHTDMSRSAKAGNMKRGDGERASISITRLRIKRLTQLG